MVETFIFITIFFLILLYLFGYLNLVENKIYYIDGYPVKLIKKNFLYVHLGYMDKDPIKIYTFYFICNLYVQ